MPIQRHIIEATGNLILQDQITSHGISDGISEPSIRGKDRKRIYASAPTPHWSEIVLWGTNCPALVGHTWIGTEQFHVYSLDRDVLGRRRGRDCQDAPE